jgi:hypothetical protein
MLIEAAAGLLDDDDPQTEPARAAGWPTTEKTSRYLKSRSPRHSR